MDSNVISIRNAKVHNLKSVSLDIPKNKFVVITGVSGSGKSSLAFDTIFAEGQRRYVESLSSYARQFLGVMDKPDVESITGLSPAISIDQKSTGNNPRSTVGTITEIYDYLRLLYARVGMPFCPNCNEPIRSQSIDSILSSLVRKHKGKVIISSPIVVARKGIFKNLFTELTKKGINRIIIDGESMLLEDALKLNIDKNVKHTIDAIIDRLVLDKVDYSTYLQDELKRFRDSLELSTSLSNGLVKITDDAGVVVYSEKNACPKCGFSLGEISPSLFSFNAPIGACSTCSGLGYIKSVDPDLIVNPNLSITEGGIFPIADKMVSSNWTYKRLSAIAEVHQFSLSKPIKELSKEVFDLVMYGIGTKEHYEIDYKNRFGIRKTHSARYEGVIPEIMRRFNDTASEYARKYYSKYLKTDICSDCGGNRLNKNALSVRVSGFSISELTDLSIEKFYDFISGLRFDTESEKTIAEPIVREILERCRFLLDVGLSYLSLSRRANTLSGGESQRIRLASQIGSGLTGVLYVLDEPSIGLHARDVSRLIDSLNRLKSLGNTLIVVEHDEDTMKNADWIVDVGPNAGIHGGEVLFNGPISEFADFDSTTADYLFNRKKIGAGISKNTSKPTKFITLSGVSTNNLKNVNLNFPLERLVVVTGVSGSGKSSLIIDTLIPALKNKIRFENFEVEGEESEEVFIGSKGDKKYTGITGYEHIDKMINIDQKPIGRTPRSNPATYTGLFTYVRDIFAQTQEARARGYKSGRFSFNVKGGRCEKCRGDGQIKIEMQFLADVYVECEECKGKRYNSDALQIDYKGRNIAEVLDMTIEEAYSFFETIPSIARKLKVLIEVGVGYLKLGQSATTLSGGEAQRIKLAKELSKVTNNKTLYILDEPSTGLHFYDVDKLVTILRQLVDKGNTVLVIEHNMDIIRSADWIVDVGPEGGDGGGEILYSGELKGIKDIKSSYTAKFI